ncbi:phosphatidylinositol 3-kinase [Microbotryum lychnidis-dioicae p1A1 Lamole]|uniref:Phosphatidylinositol 3-kinase VPS34 n=1 Tax=Microbotryum lychnidis-dioicae (strain p1A1 Lamole / MvSl-1064) TaxID=683840 RepID=U5H3U1_USTV1|nr:phosphatidylinositol 3-kinase [Microbotryum lychnidis-dioicae p1A1 Lamole]|eukprot:KDE07724.1 phosphatidylinositol 3-kinase [Microbotryum lychnidis-dioicae p1A1 Lamole]
MDSPRRTSSTATASTSSLPPNTSHSSLDSSLTFVRHHQLTVPLQLRLCSLVGPLPTYSLTTLLQTPSLKHSALATPPSLPPDLFLILQLYSSNKPILPPWKSSYKSFKSRSSIEWNSEPIEFGIQCSDLPLDAQLATTVYSLAGPDQPPLVIGGSTLPLFSKNKRLLKAGKQRLFLHRDCEADGKVPSTTPSKLANDGERGHDRLGVLEKCVRRHESGEVRREDWVDKLAFRQIEKSYQLEASKSPHLFLYIDLPRFDFPVVFSEHEYTLPTLASPAVPLPGTTNAPTIEAVSAPIHSLFPIIDPEIVRENPVEAKHRRLVRSHRSGPLDRELKPNAKIRDELNDILRYPPTRDLTSTQRDLLWQFRFYLTRDKRALTKFLKAVAWSDPGEVQQAVEVLLGMWVEIEMDDALELLGPGEAFRDRRVRAFAVKRLEKADDEELMLYLLQLVQAIKFEPPPPSMSPSSSTSSSMLRHSRHLGHSHSHHHHRVDPSTPPTTALSLIDFLIERSAQNPVLGNHFHWYIQVETEDKERGSLFADVGRRFERRVAELEASSSASNSLEMGPETRRDGLRRQTDLIARLSSLAYELRMSKDARPKKIERLRAYIRAHLLKFDVPIALPLDAKTRIVGIDPERSSVFKSNLFPLKLHFLTSEGGAYPVIFKNGDDLRQDQLVIQLFTLMDRLLLSENLDLKLMPYRVLATAQLDGMVQFVESKTLQDILNEFGAQGLLGYLKQGIGNEGVAVSEGVVRAEVLDTYVRSCAGYCVVTYLLGVGDRHLDNLLLSPDGHFFHVDFGYILGRDPKPFPPAVKVCKEMVDAMGGLHSTEYKRFKKLCGTAFSLLRKNGNLLINLVSLMTEANIQDIKIEPDKAVGKVQDKFLLHLSEEEAIKQFEALLNETSYFTSVLDRIHSVAQYWRS